MDSPAVETTRNSDWIEAKWDTTNAQQARLRYAIAGAPPTGSVYLSSEMRRRGIGTPFPYFDDKLLPKMASRLGCWDVYGHMEPDDYLAALAAKRTTANGVFGVEVRPGQLRPFVGEDFRKAAEFMGRFDKVIVLRRRDKLLHAIATARSRIEKRQPEGRPAWMDTESLFFHGIVGECLSMAILGDNFASLLERNMGSERVFRMDFEDLADQSRIDAAAQWLLDGRNIEPPSEPPASGGERFDPAPSQADLEMKRRFLKRIGAFA